ncbi:MAG: hypothetical protein ACRCZ2_11590, partial [Fusobacteriaceae bacterium]
GRNNFTLNSNNIPSHGHGITVKEAGNHSHVVDVNDGGNHSHGGNIGNGGNHSHGISDHSHSIQPHKHTIPWGEHWSGHFPYGVNGTNNKTGQGAKVDNDNFWFYSEPIPLHTDSSRSSIYEAGNHSHGLSINEAGNHRHAANANQNGSHGHEIYVGNTGEGNAVSYLPSFLTVNVYKRVG